MKEEKILSAIDCIDSSFLEEALNYKTEKTSKNARKTLYLRIAAIAAAVAVSVSAAIIYGKLTGNRGAGLESHANPISVGETRVFGEKSVYYGTSVYYKSYADNRLTIVLDKRDGKEIFWYIEGRYVISEYLDENGKPAYDMESCYASTSDEYVGYGTRLEEGISFTVNGVENSDFPVENGVYEVVIDFSSVAEKCSETDPYIVSGYEAFYVGEYAFGGSGK